VYAEDRWLFRFNFYEKTNMISKSSNVSKVTEWAQRMGLRRGLAVLEIARDWGRAYVGGDDSRTQTTLGTSPKHSNNV